jgi:hypothetical protein
MDAPKKTPARMIIGQVIYMGPQVPHLGLSYSNIFRDGIHPHLYNAIAQCPALGALFIPIAECARVRLELNFDYAHNMKGTKGSHVAFYKEVQRWIAELTKTKPKPSGITMKQTHHA